MRSEHPLPQRERVQRSERVRVWTRPLTVRQHVQVFHDRRQRHRERPGQLAHRKALPLAQLRQQRASRRVGQGREGAIQRAFMTVNHRVNYLPATRRRQAPENPVLATPGSKPGEYGVDNPRAGSPRSLCSLAMTMMFGLNPRLPPTLRPSLRAERSNPGWMAPLAPLASDDALPWASPRPSPARRGRKSLRSEHPLPQRQRVATPGSEPGGSG